MAARAVQDGHGTSHGANPAATGPLAVTAPDPQGLPAEPGAYVLDIRLGRPLRLAIPTLGSPLLAPGRYVYAGSARGPGGIRARARRHLRPRKSRHWHVDYLTLGGEVVRVVALPGARECAAVDRLVRFAAARAPLPGFGSSDCGRCRAHLLSVAPALDLEEALAGL